MKVSSLRKLVNHPFLCLPDDCDVIIDRDAENFNLYDSFKIEFIERDKSMVRILCYPPFNDEKKIKDQESKVSFVENRVSVAYSCLERDIRDLSRGNPGKIKLAKIRGLLEGLKRLERVYNALLFDIIDPCKLGVFYPNNIEYVEGKIKNKNE